MKQLTNRVVVPCLSFLLCAVIGLSVALGVANNKNNGFTDVCRLSAMLFSEEVYPLQKYIQTWESYRKFSLDSESITITEQEYTDSSLRELYRPDNVVYAQVDNNKKCFNKPEFENAKVGDYVALFDIDNTTYFKKRVTSIEDKLLRLKIDKNNTITIKYNNAITTIATSYFLITYFN